MYTLPWKPHLWLWLVKLATCKCDAHLWASICSTTLFDIQCGAGLLLVTANSCRLHHVKYISWSCIRIKLMGSFKVYTTFNKNLGQTAPSAWNFPKTQPLTNWKVDLSPRPHTHSDLIINKHTEQVKKTTHGFIMVCTDLPATGQNSLTHWKARIWLSWLSQIIPDTPTKTGWSRAQFQKAYPLQNYVCF